MKGLRTPVTVTIPPNADRGTCKSPSCRAPIFWVVTEGGKRTPVNPDGVSHFATCPDSAEFRHKRELERRLAEIQQPKN